MRAWLRLGAVLGVVLSATQMAPLAWRAENAQGASDSLPPNPHGDFIFEVTGTKSCMDCHGRNDPRGGRLTVLDNAAVQNLKAKAQGVHGPGRFADCFRCHAGGTLGIGKYKKSGG